MRYIFTFLMVFLLHNVSTAQKTDVFKMRTVVIDPGHGGNDPGCTFGQYKEKDITLDISLRLGKKIKAKYPDIKVVYTREKDVAVSLYERGNIANKAKADLFISIHVNSTGVKATTATGTETFTLGLHKSDASMEVAKKENSVIALEDGYEKNYQGFDPKDPESYIMFGLVQYGFNRSSIIFADMLEAQNKSYAKRPSRGVKQAGFLVLWASAMPAVLTEVGFLNNPNDRAVLTSTTGRDKMATAIFNAFSEYKKSVEVESHYEVSKSPVSDTKTTKYSRSSRGYAIQLATFNKKVAIDSNNFGKYSPMVFEINDKGKHKYFVGVLDSYEEATTMKNSISSIEKRYKDCYVVGINNGTLTTPAEMRKLLGQ